MCCAPCRTIWGRRMRGPKFDGKHGPFCNIRFRAEARAEANIADLGLRGEKRSGAATVLARIGRCVVYPIRYQPQNPLDRPDAFQGPVGRLGPPPKLTAESGRVRGRSGLSLRLHGSSARGGERAPQAGGWANTAC